MKALRQALFFACAVLLSLYGTGALAQMAKGNLYVVVQDDKGTPLAGATVEVSGSGPTQTQLCDAEGQVRFLGLDPGDHTVKAEREGFATAQEAIRIQVGRNLSMSMTLRRSSKP